MQLRPTDLPDPVVPATSRCGIGARSAITGSPAIFLPRISGSAMFWSSNAWLPISSDRLTGLALGIGQLDPDHAAARDGRDPGRQRRHVAGDVVGELDHPAGLDPARRLQLVHGDHRARANLDDIAADVEILEHRFEQPRIALEPGAVDLLAALLRGAARAGRGSAIGSCRRARALGCAAALRPWPRPAGAIGRAGSATATAGRDRGGAAAVGRSSVISVARGAARRSRGSRRNSPDSHPFSSGDRPSAK